MKKLILIGLFVMACAQQALSYEPYKNKPIPSELFHPVTTDLIFDYKVEPSKSPRVKPKNTKPKPIVVNLTPPTPKPQNKKEAPSVAAARRYAMDVLGSTQYYCIDQIFDHESNWNPYSLNKSSGAYGIPQALPGSKMAVIADDWRTNPITQVKWGIKYVNGRYGSACAAWKFWQNNRWY